jgi:hypothetical protein
VGRDVGEYVFLTQVGGGSIPIVAVGCAVGMLVGLEVGKWVGKLSFFEGDFV